MNTVLVRRLIRKDWDLVGRSLGVFFAVGIIGLGVLGASSSRDAELGGAMLMLTSLLLTSSVLVTGLVLHERRDQTLSFIMSLPVTVMDYTWAKVIFCFGTYLAQWLVLIASSIVIIIVSPRPDGILALGLPAALLLLCGPTLRLSSSRRLFVDNIWQISVGILRM